MKNYRILSLLALVLMLAMAGGASSLILNDSPADVALQSQAVTAKAVKAEAVKCVPAAECSDGPCVPMTPEQCAAKMGVSVETVKQWMKECQNGTTASVRLINSRSAQCDPADCEPGPNCKTAESCSSAKVCKTASSCNSRNIDASI